MRKSVANSQHFGNFKKGDPLPRPCILAGGRNLLSFLGHLIKPWNTASVTENGRVFRRYSMTFFWNGIQGGILWQ